MQEQLIDIISDPIDGPYYGEDYSLDDQGHIQVNGARISALIIRKVNAAKVFALPLVRLGTSGDMTILGFDTLNNVEPIYLDEIGPDRTPVAVKQDVNGKFCLYMAEKRSSRMFNKLAQVKKYLKQLDKELQQVAEFEDLGED